MGADPSFPVREQGLTLLPMQAQLELTLNGTKAKTETLYVRAPSKLGERWRLLSDDAWLQFEPQNGPCDGQIHEVMLSILLDN